MKSVFEEAKNIPKEISFPVLAKCVGIKGDTFVVLFRTLKSGTVVYSEIKERTVGDYEDGFYDVTRGDKWEILDDASVITLCNSKQGVINYG